MHSCSYCGRNNDDTQAKCADCGTAFSSLRSSLRAALTRKFSRPLVTVLLAVAWVSLLGIAFLRSEPKRMDTIEIRGSRKFKVQVAAALTLLKTKSPEAYQVVTDYIGA